MMKDVIGHVGEPDSGKETVGDIIAKIAKEHDLTASRHRFRDILEETLQRLLACRASGWSANSWIFRCELEEILGLWNLERTPANFEKLAEILLAPDAFGDRNVEVNRANLQKMAQIMVRETAFGPNALANAVRHRLMTSSADIVQADGVRWLADEELLRNIPNSLILYTTASLETRYQRELDRRREGGETLTREQFLAQNQAKNEIHIPEIGSRADWKIVNEGTLEELEEKVREFWEIKVRPILENKQLKMT